MIVGSQLRVCPCLWHEIACLILQVINPMFSVNRRRLDITTLAIYIRQSKLLMTKWSHSHRICGCQITIYILKSLMRCKIAANLFAVLTDILVVQPHQFGDICNWQVSWYVAIFYFTYLLTISTSRYCRDLYTCGQLTKRLHPRLCADCVLW